MTRRMENLLREREEINNLYRSSKYRRLKYWSIAIITLCIALQIARIFLMDYLPPKVMLLLQGVTGLVAVIFIIVYVIMVYRVNKDHIKSRSNKNYE